MVTLQVLILSFGVRILVIQQKSYVMEKFTGYKKMLRDRCPRVVSFALKWCKAKERWLNLVYNTYIRTDWEEYNEKNKLLRNKKQIKLATTRLLLGIKEGKPKQFVFDTTIAWKDLTEEDKEYWLNVSGWVGWFTEKFTYIENTYNISRSLGKSEFDCKVEIIQKYLSDELPDDTTDEKTKNEKFAYVNKLTDYLVDCIESIKK